MEKYLNRFIFFILIVFTGLLYFSFLGSLDLWNPDEPRYVEVAREMIALKNYIIPHLNGHVYAHKPPMFFWAIAFMFEVFGEFKVWIARLVPAISGFFIVIITYFYASSVFNKKVGFFSAIILSSTVTMMHLSRRCNIDTLFTLFILIAIYLLHLGIINKDKQKIYFLLSCVFQGIGVITKGPLAFIFPFFTLLSYCIFTNDRKTLKKTPWFLGLIVILAITCAWLIPAAVTGGKEYIMAIALKHTIGRYAHGINHPRNFFYYFYMFPLDFMPWSFFLPLVISKGLFNRKEKMDKNILWFFCWFVINFIFMSFSTEKRGLYLLPLYPAAAIIFGYYLEKIKNFKIPVLIIAGSVILASITMPILYYYKAKHINALLTVLSAISFWGGIFLIKYQNMFKSAYKIFILYLIWSIAIFNVYAFFFPFANKYKSPKVFINELSPYENNWDNIVFFNYYNPGINFYLGKLHIHTTKNKDELKKFIQNKINVIVVKNKSLKDVKKLLTHYKYVKTLKVGHRTLKVFIRER